MGIIGSTTSITSTTSSRLRTSRGTSLRSLRWLAALVLAAALGAGCDDDGPDEPAGPPVISLQVQRRPLLLAFREHGGAWQNLALEAGHETFELEVAGAYEVVVVCEQGSERAQAFRYARVPADGAMLGPFCPAMTLGLPPEVTGTLAQTGLVAISGKAAASAQPNWTFSFRIYPGLYDVILCSRGETAFDRMTIRRGVEVSDDLDLGVIDLVGEAAPTPAFVAFTPTNALPGDLRSSRHLWTTSRGTHTISAGASNQEPWRVPVAPPSLLRSGDRQVVALESRDVVGAGDQLERILYVAPDAPSSVTLPPRLDAATFVGSPRHLTVTVPELASHDHILLTRNSWDLAHPDGVLHQLLVSRGFLEATGTTQLELQFLDVPGFLDTWSDPENQTFQRYDLQATRGVTGEPGSTTSRLSRLRR